MQIRKLALGLWVISLHRYLWLKKLALFPKCSICLICFDSQAIYSCRYLWVTLGSFNDNKTKSFKFNKKLTSLCKNKNMFLNTKWASLNLFFVRCWKGRRDSMYRDEMRMNSRPHKSHHKCRESKSQDRGEICQRRRSSSGKGTTCGQQQQQMTEQQQIRQLVSSCGCVHSLSGGGGGTNNAEEMVRQRET